MAATMTPTTLRMANLCQSSKFVRRRWIPMVNSFLDGEAIAALQFFCTYSNNKMAAADKAMQICEIWIETTNHRRVGGFAADAFKRPSCNANVCGTRRRQSRRPYKT